MSIAEALRLAVQGLLANRLRSGLTMLGILIGVGAVILLVAVGNGASVAVQNQVQALGSNIVYIYPSSTKSFGGGVSQGFANLVDGGVEVVFDVDEGVRPQALLQLVSSYKLAGTLQQNGQHLEGLTAQF